ncbi:MAG: anti-anti-sigma factor [Flavobacteriaceae bacterium]|nr:anti-anti-sigma factor [Flavobacteriaceae bacterium]|tara:strand:+ start:52997 stop:53338 length:342 start_codon:yes stop_codon:yes gene_type:complete
MNKITNVEKIGSVVVISTEGYLNKDLGEEIQNAAQEHIKTGTKSFLINLERSNIVNSIGASILIELIEELQEIEGDLAFCELAPIIEKTFKIMGLTKYCKTYSSQEEAIESMS